jgi:EAL domain-containing protein (putative c-di-GMP-specific phosphodiesterase class I)
MMATGTPYANPDLAPPQGGGPPQGGDQYVLFSQPIVELLSGRVSHYELLLRVRRADGHIALPGEWIETVREQNRETELDRWVAEQALAMLRPPDVQPGPQLEINISRESAIGPELPTLLNHKLFEKRMSPEALIVEVAQGEMVAPGELRHFRDRAFRLACHFSAVDSEEEAFTKLAALSDQPFDWVKIDGEFVRGLPASTENQAIIKRVVTIAKGFGRRTVALHIEDLGSLELLREAGVDYGQGFFLGKPEEIGIA